jgi:hypothetical protein
VSLLHKVCPHKIYLSLLYWVFDISDTVSRFVTWSLLERTINYEELNAHMQVLFWLFIHFSYHQPSNNR